MIRVQNVKIGSARLTADVVIAHVRHEVVLDSRSDEAKAAIAPLIDYIAGEAKADLAAALQDYLTPSASKALKG